MNSLKKSLMYDIFISFSFFSIKSIKSIINLLEDSVAIKVFIFTFE